MRLLCIIALQVIFGLLWSACNAMFVVAPRTQLLQRNLHGNRKLARSAVSSKAYISNRLSSRHQILSTFLPDTSLQNRNFRLAEYESEWSTFLKKNPTRSQLYLRLLKFSAINTVQDAHDFCVRKYGSNEPFFKLYDLHRRFVWLLVDVGLVYRLDKFVEFVKDNNYLQNSDVFDVREKFSQYLGSTLSYRAMMLDSASLVIIKADGIHSHFLKFQLDNSIISDELNLEESTLNKNIFKVLKDHVEHVKTRHSDYLVSMSDFPEVAVYGSLIHSEIKDKKLYMFKIKTPVLDTLSWNEKYEFEWNNKYGKVEKFAMLGILPNEIVEIYEVNDSKGLINWYDFSLGVVNDLTRNFKFEGFGCFEGLYKYHQKHRSARYISDIAKKLFQEKEEKNDVTNK